MSSPQLSSLYSSTHENTKHNWLVDRTKSKPIPPRLVWLLARPGHSSTSCTGSIRGLIVGVSLTVVCPQDWLTTQIQVSEVFQAYVRKSCQRSVVLFGKFFCICKAREPSCFRAHHGCGCILGNVVVGPWCHVLLRCSKYHKQRLFRLRHIQPPHFLFGMGRAPGSRQPDTERFHTVARPWNGQALYLTEHCSGKRGKGRIEKGMEAS